MCIRDRIKVAKFINCSENEVIFTSGATAALNLVAYSWGMKHLSAGDEIIITIAEHHANIVPWQIIAEQKNVKIKAAHVDPNSEFNPDIIKNLVTDKTKIIVKWSKIEDKGIPSYKRFYGPQFLLQISGSGLVAPSGMFFNAINSKFQIGNFLDERFTSPLLVDTRKSPFS